MSFLRPSRATKVIVEGAARRPCGHDSARRGEARRGDPIERKVRALAVEARQELGAPGGAWHVLLDPRLGRVPDQVSAQVARQVAPAGREREQEGVAAL